MTEPEAVPQEQGQRELPDELDQYVSRGHKALALKNFEEAADLYSLANEEYSRLNDGADDPYLLLYYGRALFQVALKSSKILGGNSVDEDPNSTDVDKADMPTDVENSSKKLFFSGDGEAEDEEDENGAGENNEVEVEDDQDEFSVAWEVLDLARALITNRLEEHGINDARLLDALSDVYDLLGEISLEGENFDQAAEDLTKALEIKTKRSTLRPQLLAEAHYKVALALEFTEAETDRTRALEHVRKAIEKMEMHLETLRKEESEQKHIIEAESLIADLKEKETELSEPKEVIPLDTEADISKEEILKKLSQAVSSGGANDLSATVRRKGGVNGSTGSSSGVKRKADNDAAAAATTPEEQGNGDSKRTKVEDESG